MDINYEDITYPELKEAEERYLHWRNFFNLDFAWVILQQRGSFDVFLRCTLDRNGLTAREARRFSCLLGARQTDAISVLTEDRGGCVFAVTYLVLEPEDREHLKDIPALREWRSVSGEPAIDLTKDYVEDPPAVPDEARKNNPIMTEPLTVCLMKEDIFQTRKFKSLAGIPFVKNDICPDGVSANGNWVPCPTMFLCARYHDGSEQAEFLQHLKDPHSEIFYHLYSALSFHTARLVGVGMDHFRKKIIDDDIAYYAERILQKTDEEAMQTAKIPKPLEQYVLQAVSELHDDEKQTIGRKIRHV